MIVTMYTAIVLLVPVCNVWLLQCTAIVLVVPVCNVWLLQCTQLQYVMYDCYNVHNYCSSCSSM